MSPSASSDNFINIDDQAQNDLLVPNKKINQIRKKLLNAQQSKKDV